MKKLLCIILSVTLLFVAGMTTNAAGDNQARLSDLSGEECIAFLKEQGVEIPSVPEDDMAWGAFAHSIVVKVEENPNATFLYGSTTLLNFANDIKAVVNDYYNRASVALCDVIISPADILQDSTVHGSWINDYSNFNCYAYAIGEEEGLDPGVSIWISLGNDANRYQYNGYANMNTITFWIESDLEYFGYTVNSITNTRPDTLVGDHVHLICVRKDADGIYLGENSDGEEEYFHDYHFMKLGEDGYWYHKPGETNPLKYNYQPTSDRSWLSEGYFQENDGNYWYFFDPECTYDSEIYFIEYTTPHVREIQYYGMTSDGTHQHISLCTVCGEANGDPMNCMYSTGSNICRFCGHNKNTAVGVYGLPEELQPVA